jgi:hypothetical protein
MTTKVPFCFPFKSFARCSAAQHCLACQESSGTWGQPFSMNDPTYQMYNQQTGKLSQPQFLQQLIDNWPMNL